MSRNFDSFIEAFLDYNKNIGAPEKFLLWSAIAGISGCLNRKTWVVYNGVQTIYPNLFVMLVANSGIAKKSTAGRAIMELMYEVDGLKFMSTQMSGASLVEQLVKAGDSTTFEFQGKKYKNSSLFSYSSEAKVTIGDAKGLTGIQELLTDFYDCGDPNIWHDKKGWNKQTLSGGDKTVFNPCLSLLYCSTPTWLIEAVGKSGIAGGFASRVIFVTQKERPQNSLGWLDDDELGQGTSPETREKLIQDLQSIAKMQGRFQTVKGFKDKYNEILADTNRRLDDDPNGEMSSYYSRKMWHCMKLAQVLAADRSDDLVLTPSHLEWANDLLKKLEPEMYEPFNQIGENKNLASFTKVWEILRRKPKWTKTEMIRATYLHANAAQLDEHIRTLQSMGKIRFSESAGPVSYVVSDNKPL